MRYILAKDEAKCPRLQQVGNIDVTGSVLGMQKLCGWPRGGQVRCGGYIYNVGVAEVRRRFNFELLLRQPNPPTC
jgi:hypothetical protein